MNIVKYLPKQIHIPYVGALWDLAGRVAFLVSMINYVFMSRLYYYNTGDSYLRDIFGSYVLFTLAILSVVLVAFTFMWAFVVPSHNKFCQEQAYTDGRSPLYDAVIEMREQLSKMQAKLDEMQAKLDRLEKKI
jgi:uncharacterized membrane protein